MKRIFIILASSVFLLFFFSCRDLKNATTTIEIADNNRHYYPVLMGQKVDMSFEITNTGENPFFLSDIISSCGCITLKKSSIKTIPAGKNGFLLLTYDSGKNIGYVQHHITLYGNFATSETKDVIFDIHVVPQSLYTKDYEELYNERDKQGGGIKGLVDGRENNKGYYMDEDFAQ